MASESSVGEPSYGRRIFVNVIDDVARTDPSRVCISIPCSPNTQDGWKDVSYRQYANSINRLSHWIINKAGISPEGEFPTFAYVGPNDIRYFIFIAAAAKCHFKVRITPVLFVSPRNSKEGQLSLFGATDCKWVFYASENETMVQPWLQERNMKSAVVDPVDTLLVDEKVPHVPYSKDFEEARWDPYMVLHTSGSTGTPKPIICRHGMIALSDYYHYHATWCGYDHLAKVYSDRAKRTLLTMPLFHALGIYFFLSVSIYWESPIVLSRPEKAVTPDTVVETIKDSLADAVILPPSTAAEMSNYDEYVKTLKKMAFVTTGGGAMEPEAGDRLVKAGVELQMVISSTEYGFYPVYWQSRKDLWRYFIFNNDLFGCDYQKRGENVYEQIIVRNNQESILQGPFYTFPGSSTFETKDLYQPHPTLAHHWLHSGRIDDVIVFSNGEKLNPVSIESIVGTHPEIQRAVVVGQGRFQAGMILEPIQYPIDKKARHELLGRVWPLVQSANAQTVAHGRIARHLITISDPNKPFPYSSKGSLQRGSMLKIYEDEIESLYSDTRMYDQPALDITSPAALVQSIMDVFQTSLGLPNLEPDTDFFQQGLDSLQAINISKILNAALEKSDSSQKLEVVPRVLYQNPTSRLLSEHIYSRYMGEEDSKESTDNKIQILENILEKQIQAFPNPPVNNRPAPLDQGQTVILTGSTGSLGSYILDQMESSSTIKRIICLNRSADGGRTTQPAVNKKRGLCTSFSRTEFYHADLSKKDWGLEGNLHEKLLDSADYFIHCAWPVNFNHSVQTFEPHIQGVTKLLSFASQTKKRLAITFLSSIGSVDLWNGSSPIPESHLTDLGLSSNGYGQSKMISSAILFQGMQQLNIPSKIIRVGQVSGPRGELGAWNKSEWLPSIIASSLRLGLLPRELGWQDVVQWMPVEDVASAVLEISGIKPQQSGSDMTGYFNLLNPSQARWRDLATAVQEFYTQKGYPLEIVSLGTWVEAVEKSASTGSSHPAIQLLETFKSMLSEVGSAGPEWSLERAKTASTTLRQMGPITPEMMQRWCRQWNFEDNLPRGGSFV
ncbi:putative polyketide synthase 32 [Talaromyces islandicus]|uniref:Putative polyketide synthase 32 n=1 Tax=Talaromyces islandicus TaxID=28573 RepID=A0A0U1LQ48_TALIS|nr:putative polyketide synthase 32 [Talaromyces islandicus]